MNVYFLRQESTEFKNTGQNYTNRRIIANICSGQMAAIKIDGYEKEDVIEEEIRLRVYVIPGYCLT